MKLGVLAAAALVCLAASACGTADLTAGAPGEASVAPTGAATSSVATQLSSAAPTPVPSGGTVLQRSAIEAMVVGDLASYLNVSRDDIVVAAAEERTWIEANLGCGGRDIGGDTLPVRGFLITLKHGDTAYAYHTDRAGNWVRCGTPTKRLAPIR